MSFGLKNGVVLVVSLWLSGFHSVCVFFVLLVLMVGCFVGLVVLWWREVPVVLVWDLGRWCWVVLVDVIGVILDVVSLAFRVGSASWSVMLLLVRN